MTNIAKTLANLVKTNNGLFKSEAQAKFLIEVVGTEYVTGGAVMGNQFTLYYDLNSTGVISVRKYTVSKGFTTTWERVVDGTVSVQDAKEIKRLKRLAKSVKKSMSDRQACWDSGKYVRECGATIENAKSLFDNRQLAEQIQLNEIVAALAKFSN